MSIQKKTKSNDWLKHFKGYEEFAKRMDDCVDLVTRTQREYFTPFLNEAECNILTQVVGSRCPLCFEGGHVAAEKRRAKLGEGDTPFAIVLLHATYASQYHELSFRDCMGALYNCGLRNDQFGDIVLVDESIYVYVNADVMDYIISTVTKIKHAPVAFKASEKQLSVTRKIVTIEKIVSGTRLDILVAACCNLARSKAVDLIKGGFVQVNHLPLEDCSTLCNNNAVLSIRGYGRFVYQGVLKKTKKDNYVIAIGIYQ